MGNDVNGAIRLNPQKYVRMKRCTIGGCAHRRNGPHHARRKVSTEYKGAPRKHTLEETSPADILDGTHDISIAATLIASVRLGHFKHRMAEFFMRKLTSRPARIELSSWLVPPQTIWKFGIRCDSGHES